MAVSTCVKCGGHHFEVRQIEPAGGRYKQNMVQCSVCGVPVGVLDFFNLGAQSEDVKNKLGMIIAKLEDFDIRLRKIERKTGI